MVGEIEISIEGWVTDKQTERIKQKCLSQLSFTYILIIISCMFILNNFNTVLE